MRGKNAMQPSGTVSFLFTDIEGSTRRWERYREAMQAAVRSHDHTMRMSIRSHQGIVFKTVGDAFCAAFPTAPQAIAAAVEAQHSLESGNWSSVGGLRVRMAIHTGIADERAGDYFGRDVNYVARLLEIAHGGQVLVSNAAAQLAMNHLDGEIALRDRGSQKLRDFSSHERVFQVVGTGLQADFPPLRSRVDHQTNLPHLASSFVGRANLIAGVVRLFDSTRLVTLCGPGGTGKTRLAHEVGRNVLPGYTDGVWFVELTLFRDSESIWRAIASVLNVREVAGHSLLDLVIDALREKKLFLIIDNSEHVVTHAAAIVARILQATENVAILATSREPLRVAGERIFAVPPLEDEEAVELFKQRALAVSSGASFSAADVPVIMEICRKLDGLPLAIELAAARVKVLSPVQLLSRLDERLRLLGGGNRDAPARQQTLRALITWSYDLLGDAEQTLFRRLAIFAAGWTLAAASEVCAQNDGDSWEVFDALESLVDKSLAMSTGTDEDRRFHFLESTREYASELLAQSGEHVTLACRHANYMVAFARDAQVRLRGMSEPEWLQKISAEIGNIRAALSWTLCDNVDFALGAQLASALEVLWISRLYDEGTEWLETALAHIDELEPRVGARLLLVRSRIDGFSQRALELATESVAAYRKQEDAEGLCRALSCLGANLFNHGRLDDAADAYCEAVAIASDYGDTMMHGGSLAVLGQISLEKGDPDEARDFLDRAAHLLGTLPHLNRYSAVVERGLAEVMLLRGNADRAIAHSLRAIQIGELLGDLRLSSWCRVHLARSLLAAGRIEQAQLSARDAIVTAREAHFTLMFVEAIIVMSELFLETQQERKAALLLGFALHADAEIPVVLARLTRDSRDRVRTILEERLGLEETLGLLSEGAALDEKLLLAKAAV